MSLLRVKALQQVLRQAVSNGVKRAMYVLSPDEHSLLSSAGFWTPPLVDDASSLPIRAPVQAFIPTSTCVHSHLIAVSLLKKDGSLLCFVGDSDKAAQVCLPPPANSCLRCLQITGAITCSIWAAYEAQQDALNSGALNHILFDNEVSHRSACPSVCV
jgi:hypothetical protein